MFDIQIDPELKKCMQGQAKFIAIIVRNAMEDFHCEHLSDAQMKQLNPIIRNAIYTAIYSMYFYKESARVRSYADYQISMIPNYWEDPELLGRNEGRGTVGRDSKRE